MINVNNLLELQHAIVINNMCTKNCCRDDYFTKNVNFSQSIVCWFNLEIGTTRRTSLIGSPSSPMEYKYPCRRTSVSLAAGPPPGADLLGDPRGTRWTPLDTLRHPWTPLDTLGHPWTPLDTLGHPWTPLDTLGHPWTPLDNP
ncbi:uncharacterized protein LOC143188317 [Calliopsis andreniformis]|uniref:uncharacterized protein LOC143188317 n=1 Tax=Calliopsis andreniformis TaxID=337506 RepID=UPI003FCC4C47